jgi:hypothetical protein
MPLADFQSLVDAKLRDGASKLSPSQKDAAITEAVNRYSRHRPRTKIQTITGNGVLVTHALATDFEEGVSGLRAVEYPVDRQEPEYLDEAEYRLYRDPTTSALKIRFLALVLGNTVKAYLSYTVRHQVTDDPSGTDTVPLVDREAVSSLAAALCLEQLATFYLGTGEPTYQMAAVAYKSKSQECLDAARVLKASYREHVGVSDGVTAASVSTDTDTAFWGVGGSPFYHGGRDR